MANQGNIEVNATDTEKSTMSTRTVLLGLFIVVALTVFSGAMQGRLAHRWGPPELLARAGERLEEVPLRCGDWVAERNETLSEEEIRQLEPAGYLFRRYTNQQTGDTVSVTVLVGPHGPIAVHSPEICFSSREYRRLGERSPASVAESSGNDALWTLLFQSRKLNAHLLRVYYGWSTGSEWQAAADPRYAFARFPYLYKIQLAGIVAGTESESGNPCRAFLAAFLPRLREYQIDPTMNTTVEEERGDCCPCQKDK
jgi:hypothetical protein